MLQALSKAVKMYRNVKVEVDTQAIGSNVQKIVAAYPDYAYYIGVVKGNAYGHGMGIVPTLIAQGVNYIAVADLDEALEVRQIDAHIPVLCLAPIDLSYLKTCIAHSITLTISSYSYYLELLELIKAGTPLAPDAPLKVHLKLNTGFNRLGIAEQAHVDAIYTALSAHPHIELEGVFTHLATSGVLDTTYDAQLARFEALTHTIDLSKIPIVHLARSSTLELHDKIACANGVRIGLMLFGINQSFRQYGGAKGFLRKRKDAHIQKKHQISATKTTSALALSHGFSLKVGILELNKIAQGDIVGYGTSFVAPHDGFIAVCPIGYADGLSVNLVGHKVRINDRLYPIVGTVNMCLITLFVDDAVNLDDEVVIFGKDTDIKETARALGITPYVVMTSVNSLIPRVYV
jgi:alanine racemase